MSAQTKMYCIVLFCFVMAGTDAEAMWDAMVATA